MTLLEKPVAIGDGLFIKPKSILGNVKYIQASVVEIMEKPAALKLRYPWGEKFKRDWFPVSQLSWTMPTPEEIAKERAALAEKEAV